MSQFALLEREWPAVFEAAARSEAAAYPDPRAACFYARRALELAVAWAYKHDATLRLPYQDNLSALIHEPSFKLAAGEAVFNKARVINLTSPGYPQVSRARYSVACLPAPVTSGSGKPL
jgi:type I restriction enzyme R subunit